MVTVPKRLWVALLAACLASLGAQAAGGDAAASRPWQVIVLNDADVGQPAFAAIDRAMRDALGSPGKHPVEVYAEALDSFRFPEKAFESELEDLFARKYGAMHIDAVVTIGSPALDFAEKHRARLWPDAYLLFQGMPAELLARRELSPRTEGWPISYDFGRIADLARRLRPSTRRLVVIAGSGDEDRRILEVARIQLEHVPKTLAIEYWSDASMEDFTARVARLGRDDAVLYLAVTRDASGRIFTGRAAAAEISRASNAPVYGPFETYLGHGIVGGAMYSFEAWGRRMADLVHEVLTNPPAASAVLEPEPASCIVDARQLDRWDLGRSRLPGDCEVRFAVPSLWQEYRWYVIAALAVITAQAFLILALVLQRRGRVRAEKDALDRRAELAQGGRLALAGELTASIAHEINQPLGSILMNAGAAQALLARDPSANAELRAIVDDIRAANVRATEVIRRVRSLVTTRQAEREMVEPEAVVRDVLAVLQGEAGRRGIAIEAKVTPGLPPLYVDRVQVHQALVNLCINSMEAMEDCPRNARHLGVGVTTAAEDGVVFSVSDSGPGIPPGHLPRLFDSFFTTKPHGTGLGLSITRSIALAHGGDIAAENSAGGGAVFRFVLPAGPVPQ
jgi:signal transduction histidine kinase